MIYPGLYFLQNKGDRLYLDGTLKMNLEAVLILKKMNVAYPKNSVDFDPEFVCRLLKSIFSKEELKKCSDHSTDSKLRGFNRRKLRFAKGEKD